MNCDRSASGCRGKKSARPLQQAAAAAILALLVPAMGRAQSAWRYDHDIRLSYEFDDNVQEKRDDPVRAQVARIAYTGDVLWGGGEQQVTLEYQGGLKQHFGDIQRELPATTQFDEVPSQFVNEGTVTYLRRVAPRLRVGGQVGLKHRAWMGDGFFFINEDGSLSRSGGVRTIIDLEPLDAEHDARLQIGVDWVDEKFKNLDGPFGNYRLSGYATLSKEFGEDVEATATYSLDRIRYPGRGVLEPGDLPQNILSPLGERQENRLHELGAEVRWFGDVSIVADYAFRYRDSNSFGFRYVSHIVGIQILRPLPWGMLAHVWGQVEQRSFLEPVPKVSAGSLDTGEDEQSNVLLLRLVKDITDDYAIEARYARYRSESITLNDFYTKNIWSVGMTYRP